MFHSFRVWIVFIRQNLTSTDVRSWHLNSVSGTERDNVHNLLCPVFTLLFYVQFNVMLQPKATKSIIMHLLVDSFVSVIRENYSREPFSYMIHAAKPCMVVQIACGVWSVIEYKYTCKINIIREYIGPFFPSNTKRWNNVGSMIGQRHRRWINVKQALV